MQIQTHIGVAVAKLWNHVGQYVTRLRMRRPDRQTSPTLIPQLRRQIADALGFLKNPERAIDDLLPRRRDAREVAAFANEDLEAQLVLEQLDLLADTRL